MHSCLLQTLRKSLRTMIDAKYVILNNHVAKQVQLSLESIRETDNHA
jgi:hypothetical protein